MLEQLGIAARKAKRMLAGAGTELKNEALEAIASSLEENADIVLEANARDISAAEQNGMSVSLLDRLRLTGARITAMANGVREIAALPDPCGRVLYGAVRPNGMRIEKVSVPLGVIAVIFEARPNVTSDAAALCLKAGNAVVLRGGKEAYNSNRAVADIMRAAISQVGLDENCIQLVSDTSRESALELMKMNKYIDVLIPRGGAGLIRACVESSSVPVIETGTGNCHIYVDEHADLHMAASVIYNAKVSRPSVCNACESLVIHKAIAAKALPLIKQELDKAGVTIHGDSVCKSLIDNVVPATDEDYAKEYLGYDISVKTVESIDEAIEHIDMYSTGHSESIITESYVAAEKFLKCVDSAAVYVNASTRFTDGGEFGFGAEIGISTQKLHARGPLGLPELTTFKYVIRAEGQIR